MTDTSAEELIAALERMKPDIPPTNDPKRMKMTVRRVTINDAIRLTRRLAGL